MKTLLEKIFLQDMYYTNIVDQIFTQSILISQSYKASVSHNRL